MPLDPKQLKKGARCLYKGRTLIYQASKTTANTPYYIFYTPANTEKKLSEPETIKEVWLEIS